MKTILDNSMRRLLEISKFMFIYANNEFILKKFENSSKILIEIFKKNKIDLKCPHPLQELPLKNQCLALLNLSRIRIRQREYFSALKIINLGFERLIRLKKHQRVITKLFKVEYDRVNELIGNKQKFHSVKIKKLLKSIYSHKNRDILRPNSIKRNSNSEGIGNLQEEKKSENFEKYLKQFLERRNTPIGYSLPDNSLSCSSILSPKPTVREEILKIGEGEEEEEEKTSRLSKEEVIRSQVGGDDSTSRGNSQHQPALDQDLSSPEQGQQSTIQKSKKCQLESQIIESSNNKDGNTHKRITITTTNTTTKIQLNKTAKLIIKNLIFLENIFTLNSFKKIMFNNLKIGDHNSNVYQIEVSQFAQSHKSSKKENKLFSEEKFPIFSNEKNKQLEVQKTLKPDLNEDGQQIFRRPSFSRQYRCSTFSATPKKKIENLDIFNSEIKLKNASSLIYNNPNSITNPHNNNKNKILDIITPIFNTTTVNNAFKNTPKNIINLRSNLRKCSMNTHKNDIEQQETQNSNLSPYRIRRNNAKRSSDVVNGRKNEVSKKIEKSTFEKLSKEINKKGLKPGDEDEFLKEELSSFQMQSSVQDSNIFKFENSANNQYIVKPPEELKKLRDVNFYIKRKGKNRSKTKFERDLPNILIQNGSVMGSQSGFSVGDFQKFRNSLSNIRRESINEIEEFQSQIPVKSRSMVRRSDECSKGAIPHNKNIFQKIGKKIIDLIIDKKPKNQSLNLFHQPNMNKESFLNINYASKIENKNQEKKNISKNSITSIDSKSCNSLPKKSKSKQVKSLNPKKRPQPETFINLDISPKFTPKIAISRSRTPNHRNRYGTTTIPNKKDFLKFLMKSQQHPPSKDSPKNPEHRVTSIDGVQNILDTPFSGSRFSIRDSAITGLSKFGEGGPLILSRVISSKVKNPKNRTTNKIITNSCNLRSEFYLLPKYLQVSNNFSHPLYQLLL